MSAERTDLVVGPTKVRRIFGVDDVEAVGFFDGGTSRFEAVAVVVGDDLDSAVEPFFEPNAHFVEQRHLHPAGFHGAGAGEAVTLGKGFCKLSGIGEHEW